LFCSGAATTSTTRLTALSPRRGKTKRKSKEMGLPLYEQAAPSGVSTQVWVPLLLLVVAALLAGCTPAGPRSLLAGKSLLEDGKYPQAIEQLKTATTLLSTNAQAWNYLGLAYHQTGQLAEAEKAYRRALTLNRDLAEAHYNLGCLWLTENKLEGARAELTDYTLRRGNSVEGYLKLGSAQLRSRDLAGAEKSFSDALRLSPQSAEALTGVGLVRVQRGRAGDAVQFFKSALKQQPDYGPALLNLAVVEQQYLRDPQAALATYREYVGLKPPPENAEAVRGIVRQLEQDLNGPARAAATGGVGAGNTILIPAKPAAEMARVANVPKAPATNATRLASAPKPLAATNAPKPTPSVAPSSAASLEVVRLQAEPVLKPAQDVATTAPRVQPGPVEPLVTTSAAPASVIQTKPAKRGLFQRLFGSEEKPPVRPTPLPPMASASLPDAAGTPTAPEEPAAAAESHGVAPGGWARYRYRAPAKPVAGNRAEAERSFAQGLQAQTADHLPEAIQAYRRATQLDPTYFDAYYNCGLAATGTGNLPMALAAYEEALAIRPESLDARYNFALALKQANYVVDAAAELEKILVTYPNESRTHLALGNLYAQQLRQPAKARAHYLRVLETDPRNPQAAAVRYWLTDNPR
jgi:tetratricopeptide (TPR) repeat protein